MISEESGGGPDKPEELEAFAIYFFTSGEGRLSLPDASKAVIVK
jgi:hypothetical protein